jgi:hypothetical protein
MQNGMSSRERILGALRGEEIDRTPWCPFLAYYWESLPQSERAAGQEQYLINMGADPMLRGFHQLYDVQWNCAFETAEHGNRRRNQYSTAVGVLTEEYTYSPGADSWFLTGHPVKTQEDFKILTHLYEHLRVVPQTAGFERDKKRLGDGGLYIPVLGVRGKTAFQSLVEHWCGTEGLAYALCDFPETVEDCLRVMCERDRETVAASLDSSAEVMLFWEDSSTTNISPAFFEDYTAPEIAEWGAMLHREGRLLMHHACGHLKALLPLIANTPIDALESVSPPPTGNVELWDAAAALPSRIALVGGLEPVALLNGTLPELEARVKTLLHAMRGRRFVLANSDSCPPGVAYEKFTLVSRLVKTCND